MADDSVFEFLHAALVNYVVEEQQPHSNNNSRDDFHHQTNQNKNKPEEDLSNLEYVGFAMGYRMIERLTKEMSRFKDELDTMKFICTDFWTAIYKKQIDNLRTNHQGVYVLQDNDFRFLSKISNGKQYLEFAPRYVAFTCGVIRGGLANLGITSLVTAEVQTMPMCKFHIQVQRT